MYEALFGREGKPMHPYQIIVFLEHGEVGEIRASQKRSDF